MHMRTFFLSFLVAGGEAFYLAEPVVWKVRRDTTYEGAWPLYTSNSCPQNFSVACTPDTNVVQSCCKTGDTCFGGSAAYCCPTSQDCTVHITTFPTCVDPESNMFIGRLTGFFCCQNGLIGVLPSTGQGLCQDAGQTIAVSLLATMTSQIGGTSVTPFGGFGTATGAAVSSATGAANPSATKEGAPTSTSTSEAGSKAGSSTTSNGWNPGKDAVAGLAIAAAFLLGLIYIIWSRLSKRQARRRLAALSGGDPMFNGYTGYIPTSQVYQYMPPSISPLPGTPRYSPAPSPTLSTIRLTRNTATPLSPCPAYQAVETHELTEMGQVSEVSATGSRFSGGETGRVEIGS